MTNRIWHIENPAAHTIRLEHGFWSGRARIEMDGEPIFERGGHLIDTGFEHRFKIDGVPALVRCIAFPFHFLYELWVDGRLQ